MKDSGPSGRMPTLFVGHGSPMNAIEDNKWSRALIALGHDLPVPSAVLCVSAHWYVPGTYTTGNEQPETIHDFGGFPPALYGIQYPALGSLELANRVTRLIGEDRASVRLDWGLDHGTWIVLCHLLPRADVPVVQLSVSTRLSAKEHLAVGRALAALRAEGVLILGSGNIVHNLRIAFANMQGGGSEVPDWAERFDAGVAKALLRRDDGYLCQAYETEDGRLSHPTPDHYLPLLYAYGASSAQDAVTFPVEGFDLGGLSMRAARFE